jgi:hypothetical protein
MNQLGVCGPVWLTFEIQRLEEYGRRLGHYEASDFPISISTNTNPIRGKPDRFVGSRRVGFLEFIWTIDCPKRPDHSVHLL